jgi:hypothetical protein
MLSGKIRVEEAVHLFKSFYTRTASTDLRFAVCLETALLGKAGEDPELRQSLGAFVCHSVRVHRILDDGSRQSHQGLGFDVFPIERRAIGVPEKLSIRNPTGICRRFRKYRGEFPIVGAPVDSARFLKRRPTHGQGKFDLPRRRSHRPCSAAGRDPATCRSVEYANGRRELQFAIAHRDARGEESNSGSAVTATPAGFNCRRQMPHQLVNRKSL